MTLTKVKALSCKVHHYGEMEHKIALTRRYSRTCFPLRYRLRAEYGCNKMRAYQQVWEGISPEQQAEDQEDRVKLQNDLRKRIMSG